MGKPDWGASVGGLPPGALLAAGRFELVRPLGRGGMGVVYEVVDREREQRLALKVLRDVDPQGVYRFKREFRALADLHHPNLVRYEDLFEEGGRWFFTMELVRGVDFLTHVRSAPAPVDEAGLTQGALAEQRTSTPEDPTWHDDGQRIATQHDVLGPALTKASPAVDLSRLREALGELLHGLQALHAAGKLHRDIKPSNVLVRTSDSRPSSEGLVLLDFGLVAELLPSDGITRTAAGFAGTPAYVSPEQAAEEVIGPPADLYAVGVMRYEALTGHLPFDGPATAILLAKAQEEPKAPSALADGIPADLDALCLELMRRDPSERPTTRAALEGLGQGARGPEAPRPGVPPASSAGAELFVGRARELELLRAAYAHAREGEATIVRLVGESGVGKSALVERFAAELRTPDSEALVLAGRCYERESVPYKAVDGVVDSLSRHLVRLPKDRAAALVPRHAWYLAATFPVLRRIPTFAEAPVPHRVVDEPVERRSRVFSALRDLFFLLTERSPVVVVIDDLQWADVDSLMLLGELTRQPEAPPLFLLLSTRPEPQARDVGLRPELRHPFLSSAREIPLGRLEPADALELAVRLLGTEGGVPGVGVEELAAAVAREAAGHPLFTGELVRHVEGAQSLTRAPRLDEALWHRVVSLPEAARELVELVAVDGAPIGLDPLRAASALDPDRFADAVALLRAAHLIRLRSGRGRREIEPYHDRVRESVYTHLPAERLVGLHRRLAEGLEHTGDPDAERLSTHWLGAGEAERAGRLAEQAADAATEALAFSSATDLYQRAISVLADRHEDTRRLQRKLAAAFANSGRKGEAGDLYLAVAEAAAPDEALELRGLASMCYLSSVRVEDGIAVLRQIVRDVGLRWPRSRFLMTMRVLALVLWRVFRRGKVRRRRAAEIASKTLRRIDVCWAVGSGLSLLDFLCSFLFQARATHMALAAGEPGRAVKCLSMESMQLASLGWRSRAEKALRRARELCPADDAAAAAWCEFTLLFNSWQWCDLETYLSASERCEGMVRETCPGELYLLTFSMSNRVDALCLLGRCAEAKQRFQRYVQEAAERGDRYTLAMLRATGPAFGVPLLDDDPDRLRAEIDESRGWFAGRSEFVSCWSAFHLARGSLYEGEGRAALAELDASWRTFRRSGYLVMPAFRIAVHELRARACLAAALQSESAPDRRGLIREAEGHIRRFSWVKLGWSPAYSALLRGQIALLDANEAEAERAFRAAADGFHAIRMSLHEHVARLRLGEILEGEEGRKLEGEAVAWMRAEAIRNPWSLARLIAPVRTGRR